MFCLGNVTKISRRENSTAHSAPRHKRAVCGIDNGICFDFCYIAFYRLKVACFSLLLYYFDTVLAR